MDQAEARRLLNTPISLNPAPPGLSLQPAPIPPPTSFSPQAPTPSAIPPPPVPQATDTARSQLQGLEAGYRQRTEEPGVPLDTESGISPWERFMLSFRRERENQIEYLKDKYPEGTIRTDDQGELIVRVMDPETQKPKDVTIDERKMSAKDLIDVLGVAPEVAGSIIGLRAGRGGNLKNMQGMKKVGLDILTSAAGAGVAGGAKDVAVTAIDQPLSELPGMLPGIARERAKMAATDVVLGGVSYPIWRIGRMVQSPFGTRNIQFDPLEAQKYVKSKYGVDVPLTGGQITGSPGLIRTETFTEQQLGGGAPFKKLDVARESAMRQLQRIIMGKAPKPDEEIGEAAIRSLRTSATEPLEQGVATARRELQKGAEAELGGEIAARTTAMTAPERSVLGKEVRTAVTANRDAAKAKADKLYDDVRKAPGGTGKVFDSTKLSSDAADILKEIPRKGNVPLGDFAPSDVINRLNALINLKGQRMSLSELQQMRRDTLEAIPRTEGVAGRGAHYLGKIADAITAAIESNVARMPGGTLKSALEAANKHYREKVVPFNRLGLTELFRQADEMGFIPDDQIVAKVFSGGQAVNNYKLLEETLAGTPQMSKLNRAIADHILDRSKPLGDEFVDPAKFLSELGAFREQYREIADKVFGKDIGKFVNSMMFQRAAGEASLAKPQTITVDQLRGLLASPSPNVAKLRELMKAQAARDVVYRNEILKGIADGTADASTIKASEFVNRLLDRTSPADMETIVKFLRRTPDVLESVQAKAVEKIFRDAARSAKQGDIGRIMNDDPTRIVSGTGIFKQLEDKSMRSKLTALLGPEKFNDLKQYLAIEAAIEPSNVARSAGTIAAGMQVSNLIRRGPLKFLGPFYKDWIAARLLTSESFRKIAGAASRGAPFEPFDPIAFTAVLSSPPFIQAVLNEFPGEPGRRLASAVNSSISRFIQEEGGTQGDPQDQQSEAERRASFRKMLQQGMPAPVPAQ